jgi:hypothetical protein
MSKDREHRPQPRMVAYVGFDTHVAGQGYRVSFVKEGEAGHFPTGNWPYTGGPEQTLPWFWGPSLEDATRAMHDYNRQLGVEPDEAYRIIQDAITLQIRSRGERQSRPKRTR